MTTTTKYKFPGTGATNRVVALKLQEQVSVKDFGAVGDGTTDDAPAFVLALATGKSVLVPEATYKLSAGITVNLGLQSLIGSGSTLDFSTLTGTAVAITLTNSSGRTPGDLAAGSAIANRVDGFVLLGPGKAGSGAASSSTVTCFQAYASHLSCLNCLVYGFGYGVDFYTESYTNSFVNCDFGQNAIAVRGRSGGSNYGERLAFVNCVLYDNIVGIQNAINTGAMQFMNCSIDYNTTQLTATNQSVTELHACHWECNDAGAGKVMASVTGGSFLTIVGGHMQGNGTPGAFAQNGVFTTDASSVISIHDCFLFNLANTAGSWDSAGTGGGKISIDGASSYPVSYLPPVTSALSNPLLNPSFEAATIQDYWTIMLDTGAITNRLTGTNLNLTLSSTNPHSGAKSLLWTKIATGNGDIALLVPMPPGGRRFAITLWYRVPAGSNGGTVFLTTSWYRIEGTQANGTPNVLGAGAAYDTFGLGGTTSLVNWTLISTGLDRVLPPGATHLALYFAGNAFSGTLQLDDLSVTYM